MYIPKRYGESKVNKCPFCDNAAYSQNKQKVPVCKEHKNKELTELRCACGSWLDRKQGKYGVFFACINCGTVNMRKALEMNTMSEPYKVQQKKTGEILPHETPLQKTFPEKIQKKEITISSEELDFI